MMMMQEIIMNIITCFIPLILYFTITISYTTTEVQYKYCCADMITPKHFHLQLHCTHNRTPTMKIMYSTEK